MTKTQATKMARDALRYGHFAHPEGARVRCPIADRGEQHDVILYRTGGGLSHGEMVRQLTDRILDCQLNQDYEHEREVRS